MITTEIISLIGLLMGLTTFLAGGLAWYRGSVEKRYASQRDFNHLQNNYKQMAEILKHIDDEIKFLKGEEDSAHEKLDAISAYLLKHNETFVEQKAFIAGISNRMEWLAARLDTASGGWGRGGFNRE